MAKNSTPAGPMEMCVKCGTKYKPHGSESVEELFKHWGLTPEKLTGLKIVTGKKDEDLKSVSVENPGICEPCIGRAEEKRSVKRRFNARMMKAKKLQHA